MRNLAAVLLAALGAAGLARASGALNQPPPAGAILDLNGTPVPGGGDGTTFQTYTVNFTAVLSSTAITFAFRDDPAEFFVENFSVVDLAAPSINLLTNGNLAGGTYSNNGNDMAPVGWTYANIYGATDSGFVSNGCPGPTNFCWDDPSVGAYDAISQTIPTTVGHTYRISLSLTEDSACVCNFLSVSASGNAIDALVYAQSGLPAPGVTAPATPAPGTFLLMISGLMAVSAWTLRDRIRNKAFFRP